MIFEDYLDSISATASPVLDPTISYRYYQPIDLSISNKALLNVNIADADTCEAYINSYLKQSRAMVAYGGYLEERNLYQGTHNFIGTEQRNIHLGLDLWAPVETPVTAVLDGRVHSFQNNKNSGDYGPTIILRHQIEQQQFYTLYGHLSLESLNGLYEGKVVKKGERIASLGSSDINVGYAPHLHFQIIRDLEGKSGDYPGVCSRDTLGFYKKNCPNPTLLVKLP